MPFCYLFEDNPVVFLFNSVLRSEENSCVYSNPTEPVFGTDPKVFISKSKVYKYLRTHIGPPEYECYVS